jgi:hypothetical protein
VDAERGAFILADPGAATRDAAFDHERLARSLAEPSGSGVEPFQPRGLMFRTVAGPAGRVGAVETQITGSTVPVLTSLRVFRMTFLAMPSGHCRVAQCRPYGMEDRNAPVIRITDTPTRHLPDRG